MFAVVVDDHGSMQWQEVPDPVAGPGEVIIKVATTSVNRADILQRKGFYPPPAGASEILGLECSGTIVDLGPDDLNIPRTSSNLTARVTQFQLGDEVCALLTGGGYAELVAVPIGQVMRVPNGPDLIVAGSLPEVACTVWSNLIDLANLQSGQTVLIHGGAGGVGSHAIQLAKSVGARVAVTAGTDDRVQWCLDLGADIGINYNTEDFVDRIREATADTTRGANVILDNMGAKYLERNVAALAADGKLAVIGLQGGTTAEINLTKLLAKRGTLFATSLRSRSLEQKEHICREVSDHVWPLISTGRIDPIVAAELPIQEVAQAHQIVESEQPRGKVVLVVDRPEPASTTRPSAAKLRENLKNRDRLFPRLHRKNPEDIG